MIEADSVLSTPRTDSSSNIIAFAPVGRLRRNPNRALSLRKAIEIAGDLRKDRAHRSLRPVDRSYVQVNQVAKGDDAHHAADDQLDRPNLSNISTP